MYCENCGKKLIRGYQFCIECGTPVPPEQEEDDANAQAEQTAEAPQSDEMPGVKPLGSEDGTLVFCTNCGMRMQKRTDICEKCGMKLSGGSSGGSVPLVNTDPLGGDFGGISDSDIAQIDQFVNNSGFDGSGVSYGGIDDGGALGGGNLNSEIEALNRQFANLNSTASEMPAISAPQRQPEPVKPEPAPVQEEEASLGTFARRVDDFSMEAGMPETQFLSESGLPVISGGEMSEPDIPVQLEQNYDDINIEVKEPAPVYEEPAAESPAYTEAADEPTTFLQQPEVPAYDEAAAVSSYDEPAAEEPAYTEAADEPTTFLQQPEAPSYDEPAAVSSYAEPAAEEPAYTEAADEPTTFLQQPEVPAYDEPAAVSSYAEPVAEEPAYTEAADEPTTFLQQPEVPAYDETADEPTMFLQQPETPAYSEPLTAHTYAEPAETPVYAEPEPIQLNRPAPPKKEEEESVGPDLGKLVYCRNCGQDMYEKEEVCKNCGSPNKWNVKPLKHSVSGGKSQQKKEPVKLFGIFPIPSVIGAAVVVVGIIALVVFSNTAQKPDDMVSPYNSTSKSTTTSNAPANDNSDASVPDDQPVNPIVTSEQSEPEDTALPVESTEPVETVNTAEAAQDISDSKPVSVEPDDSKPENTKPAETTKATPATTKTTPNTTTKATSATTKPVVTTTKTVTTAAPVTSKPSSTVSSEDKQRDKMLDAFEAISAEVGKLHVYAQATTYALEEGKTRSFYTSGMTKTLSSGKSSAASLFKSAEPSSVQFDSAYQSLQKLYDLYIDYYTYVTTSNDSASKYDSTEATKWDSFNSAVKSSFAYKNLQTSNQTSADKSRTYAEMMTAASTAASNSVSQFTTVQNAVTALKNSTYSDKVMSTIYNDKTSNILKAAGYYQVVLNYYGVLSSGVPTEYSTAKSSLSGLSADLDELLGVFTMAGYNDLSGFKSECSSAIKAANNSISAVNKAL